MKFNVGEYLLSAIGYKGLPYPGAWLPTKKQKPGTGEDYTYQGEEEENSRRLYTDMGSVLRGHDAFGGMTFIPVLLSHADKTYDIPNAVISFTGKKTIVETSMVGRKGSVKELISVDDYEIDIQGVLLDTDFPEAQLIRLNELYSINESVTLKCALTDTFLEEDDKVVIKSVDISDMRGTETYIGIRITLVTDKSFELTIQ